MFSIISGLIVAGGGGAGLWYFMPHEGRPHPLTVKPLLELAYPHRHRHRARHRHGDGHLGLGAALGRAPVQSQPNNPSTPATKNAQSGLIRVKKATAAVPPVIRPA